MLKDNINLGSPHIEICLGPSEGGLGLLPQGHYLQHLPLPHHLSLLHNHFCLFAFLPNITLSQKCDAILTDIVTTACTVEVDQQVRQGRVGFILEPPVLLPPINPGGSFPIPLTVSDTDQDHLLCLLLLEKLFCHTLSLLPEEDWDSRRPMLSYG